MTSTLLFGQNQREEWIFIKACFDFEGENVFYLLWNVFDVDGIKETCSTEHKQWLLDRRSQAADYDPVSSTAVLC